MVTIRYRRTLPQLFALAVFGTIVTAQPMPVGPPLNRTTDGTLPVSVITSIVRDHAQNAVDEANAKMCQEGQSTRVSIESLTVNKPTRSATVLLNEPNSWYVRIPYSLAIKVAIPNSFNRRIHIPVELQAFCDGWHEKKHGSVIVRSEVGPASIEGGNILEEVLHIRDVIDARVRNGFDPPAPLTMPIPNSQCLTIGPWGGDTAPVNDDALVWDVPGPFQVQVDDAVKPTIIVVFERLKRLRARRFNGDILYADTEQIALNAYANYSLARKVLEMREGDELELNLPAIRLDARTFDTLVVIAGIEQPPHNPRDSAVAAARKAQRYSPGSHTLQIPKWYSAVDPITHKPQLTRVPAYELSYTVYFHDPTIPTPD